MILVLKGHLHQYTLQACGRVLRSVSCWFHWFQLQYIANLAVREGLTLFPVNHSDTFSCVCEFMCYSRERVVISAVCVALPSVAAAEKDVVGGFR